MDTNLKDKNRSEKRSKRNPIMSTTWGTLLLLFILALVSVGIYAPIKDNIFHADTLGYFERYTMLILAIGGISVTLLTVIALSIPYSQQKQVIIVKVFNGVYLELKFVIWLVFFAAALGLINILLTRIPGEMLEIVTKANWYFYFIGIPVTFKFFLLIYLNLCYIKFIYFNGFKIGVIKNSILGNLMLYIIEGIDRISEADFSKAYHKKLLSVLGINLLAVILFNWMRFFGILLAITYTMLLYNYALKILDRAKILNNAGVSLAQGNFDIHLPEDMGLLTPFSQSLNNIKEGFKVAVEKETKSQNMKTQLITNVSHDLKTPLTSIITYVDLLKARDIDDDIKREYVDILDRKAQRLKILIEDLFEVSRAASRDLEIKSEVLDVVALLRQTLGEMDDKIQSSELKFRYDFPDHKIHCSLDGKKTYRVFENILSNILKYAMPNTRVYLDIIEDDTTASLIFKNVSSYEMNFNSQEILERFSRGDDSRNTDGSGLGLAIAKSLTELQHGSLEIDIDGDLFKVLVNFKKVI